MTSQTSTRAVAHQDLANAVRFLAIDAIEKANSGHPGMPMGMADVATVLFSRFLKFDAKHPTWADRDRFVLSAGHGSMLLYALAYLTGYEDVDIEQIKNFRQMGARTAGHPEYGHVSIAETTTGPLGQGIANAVGFALGEAMMAARFGSELVNHRTYAIVGDGCLMEGISQEAISLAGHWNLKKLTVLWDDNHICIDGDTALSTSEDQRKRFEAAGWNTLACDGHDAEAVAAALTAAQTSDKPTLIACRTTIGFGSPSKAGTEKVHGAPLGAEEVKKTREALGWPHPAFEVPKPILEAWAEAGIRGGDERRAWDRRLDGALEAVKSEFQRRVAGRLPLGWEAPLMDFKKKMSAEAPSIATRKASQLALEVLTATIPEMIGGSADLTHSNLTNTKANFTPVKAGDYSGRYIHYGVREHGMAAIANGLILHGGLVPYVATFFVFSDYLRPALRMSALMGLRAIYVLTHDSIGLGEDGPTHQPVEHLASLRAMPNVLVLRPCDPVETAECYEIALSSEDKPSVLALSRHNLPTVRVEHVEENRSARGAYVLSEPAAERKVTILASGSEVAVALVAQGMLNAIGIATAVVSMPCWELFDQQTSDYRRDVLGVGTLRIAIEAGSKMGWDKYVGEKGVVIGLDSFGASGPAEHVYAYFGITAQAVADVAVARLGIPG